MKLLLSQHPLKKSQILSVTYILPMAHKAHGTTMECCAVEGQESDSNYKSSSDFKLSTYFTQKIRSLVQLKFELKLN